MAKNTKIKIADNTIILNRKARFNYELLERFEAGLVLTGWELKSLRAKKAQISESYVIVRDKAAWILGSIIDPLPYATPVSSDMSLLGADRTRKLLLNSHEVAKIANGLQEKGCSCVCLSLYWKKHLVKCQIALAKGKHSYDKRLAIKKRDMDREQLQALHHQSKSRRK